MPNGGCNQVRMVKVPAGQGVACRGEASGTGKVSGPLQPYLLAASAGHLERRQLLM